MLHLIVDNGISPFHSLPCLVIQIASPTRAGREIQKSIAQLLHLLDEDLGGEIRPPHSHTLSQQAAKLASLWGQTSCEQLTEQLF